MLLYINSENYIINEHTKDKKVYSTKVWKDELPGDIEEYYYKYIDGKLIRQDKIAKNKLTLDNIKLFKLNYLEAYYNNLIEQGLTYNGYVYDISQEAQEDRRDIADTINESLDLYGENSEQMVYVLSQIYFMPKVALPNNEGVLSFKSIDEWKEFSLAFMTQVVTNSNIYYTLKQKIELATTQEELDNIKF